MANLTDLELRFLWKSGDGDVTVDGTNIKSSDIVFLPDRAQLFVNDAYFGLTPAQATALTNATTNITNLQTGVSGLQTGVQALNERVEISTTLSKTLLQIANELKAKQDGGAFSGEQGAQAGAEIEVQAANGNNITNLTEAINRVYAIAQAATQAAGVTSVGNASGDDSIIITGVNSGTQGAQGPFTGAITIKTDASKIKTVTAQNQDNGKGVQITAGTSIDDALGTINTALQGIQGDIDTNNQAAIAGIQGAQGDAANALAVGQQALAAAEGAQGASILKSTGTQGAQTGFTDAALVNAAAIINDLESLFDQLQGSSSNWVTGDNAEAKTLGTLRDLIAGLRTDLTNLSNSVGTLSDADFASITDAINKIKAELNDPDNQNGLTSFLDTVKPIIGGSIETGEQAGKYTTQSGTNGAAEYASNLGEIITNLEKEIAAAKQAGEGAGVTSLNTKTGALTITGIQGVDVDNDVTGADHTIQLKATSAATLTADLDPVTNGATVQQGSTVQAALNAINAKGAQGISDAAAAQATANQGVQAAEAAQTTANQGVQGAQAAQTTANQGIQGVQGVQAQLTWVVVS